MRVLLLDNYDSFVGNLYQYAGELGGEPFIVRNDEGTVGDVAAMEFTHLILSPGPKSPADAGISVPLVKELAGRVPILGICLGHQAVGAAMGASVVAAKTVVHGKTSLVRHRGEGLFAGLPTPIVAARYHSLSLERSSMPEELLITAWTDDGEVMGVSCRPNGGASLHGLQFHPESILSELGHEILARFLAETRR